MSLWGSQTQRERDRDRDRQRAFFALNGVVIESDEDRDVGGWVFLPCAFFRVPDLGIFPPSNGHAAMGIIGECGMSFV